MNLQDTEKLVADLIAEQVEPETAARLAREVPDICRRQLSYLDYHDDIADRTTTLVASIEGDWPEPARSYWENAARRAAEEEPATPREESGSQPVNGSSAATNEILCAEPDTDVRNLLAALESIAVMSHAHRDVSDAACPVCVAWDALKQWAHRQSLHRE